MTSLRTIDVFRPYLWVGALAFLSGFGGYVALSGSATSGDSAPAVRWIDAPLAAPASVRDV